MEYLSITIQHLRKRLSSIYIHCYICLTLVKILKSIFDGANAYFDAKTKLNEVVAAYSSSIADMSTQLGIKILGQGKEANR